MPSFLPSFLPACHRQFDAIVGFVSAACSIPMAPQRSGIGRTPSVLFCSRLFSSLRTLCDAARITFHFRHLHDSAALSLTLTFIIPPSIYPSIQSSSPSSSSSSLSIFLVVSRWFNAIAGYLQWSLIELRIGQRSGRERPALVPFLYLEKIM